MLEILARVILSNHLDQKQDGIAGVVLRSGAGIVLDPEYPPGAVGPNTRALISELETECLQLRQALIEQCLQPQSGGRMGLRFPKAVGEA